MAIADIKSRIPIESFLLDVGVIIRNGKALCPFHDDRNPSLTIKNERWRCWAGCGGGDLVDFVEMYYGLDFKGAHKLLTIRAGIKYGNLTPAERAAAEKNRQERVAKQTAVATFREWERTMAHDIAAILRAYYRMRAAKTIFTEAELQELARLQGNIDYLEYIYFDVLCSRSDRDKFELYKEELRDAV